MKNNPFTFIRSTKLITIPQMKHCLKIFLIFIILTLFVTNLMAQQTLRFTEAYYEVLKQRTFYSYPTSKWDSLRCTWYGECEIQPISPFGNIPLTTCPLNKRMFGWHTIGTSSSSYIWQLISDLSYFSYDVDPSTGNAINSSQISNWATDPTIVTAQNNGVNVNLCATLFNTSNAFATFFGNSTAQSTLINNLVNAVVSANAKGINIDFEGSGLGSTYLNQFVSFMSSLSVQLHNTVPNSELSIDLQGSYSGSSNLLTQLNPFVDLFVIMGYDYYWAGQGEPGPVAPLYNFYSGSYGSVSNDLNNFLKLLSPNKVILGMPYYGRRWGVSNGCILPGIGSGSSEISTQTYSQYKQNSNGYYSNPLHDDYTFNAYNCFVDVNSVPNQQFIDDGFSFQKKYNVIKQRDIAGAAVWRLGYDAGYPDLWNLINDNLSTCSYVASYDEIYDMGGPEGNYHNLEDYTFTIAPPGATAVTLTFSSFDIESGYDYLKIYNGPTTSSPLIVNLTGNSLPSPVIATSGIMTIQFHSNGATTKPGYKAVYTSVIGCSLAVTPTNLNVSYLAGAATFTVTSNCPWTAISNSSSWCTVTSSGSGNGTIVTSYSQNPSTTARTATITVSASGTSTINVTLIQDGVSQQSNPCPGTPTVTYARQAYNTVQIGTQCWFKENLNIGTRINGNQEQTQNDIIEKYCYADLESNCDVYGGLYQWGELVQYLNGTSNNTSWTPLPLCDVQGICPPGWHLPSDIEWNVLIDFLGGANLAGGEVKESGYSHWLYPNTGATNSSGLSLLPGGFRNGYVFNFEGIQTNAMMWSSSEWIATSSFGPYAFNNSSGFGMNNYAKAGGFSARCLKNTVSSGTISVTTTSAINITQSTFMSGGSITSGVGSLVTGRGICWSTLQNPTIADNHTLEGAGTGTFTSTISLLESNTTYNIRAYATNCFGTTYGNQVSCTTLNWSVPCPGISSITYGDHVYNTVQIGTQCWMKENMNIGTMIPGTQNQANNSMIEKYCYNNLESNCAIYGGLYQWNELMQYVTTPGVQGICPPGWHIPTDAQWTTLTTFLGGESVAGGKMKSTGTIQAGTGLWNDPNTGASNESGFTAFPSGTRSSNGNFNYLIYDATLWSSTESYSNARYRYLRDDWEGVSTGSSLKTDGLVCRCLRDQNLGTPTVTTLNVTNITLSAVTSGGNVTSDEGATVTARGVCWSTTQSPTTSGSHTTDGTGTGTFTSTISGLISGTTYFIRAYATNSAGTAYGNQVICTTLTDMGQPCPNQPTVVYGGQTYNTVQIGTQCWFRENLNIGAMIPGAQNQSNNSTIEKYCYNNLESNCAVYGGLYQWNELMQYIATEGVKGICPPGWHIPTFGEWCNVTQFLDPTVNCGSTGFTGTNAGGKLKETGNNHWFSPNVGATNESGFTALPGGYRYSNVLFSNNGDAALFWSSSEYSSVSKRFLDLGCYGAGVFLTWTSETQGLSARCIKDTGSSGTASVTTSPITNITQNSATSGGNVISDGGSAITARGVCWSTAQNPTVSGDHTSDGSGIGTFTSTISGLTSNTTYYIRAYAINSIGTAYGNQVSCTTVGPSSQPCPGIAAVTYAGKTYNTVQIGIQCWFRENMNIGTKVNGSTDQTNNGIIEKYCYNDLESNCDVYGGLYQWDEAMQYIPTECIQGICPPGWHIPTYEELTSLTSFLGGEPVAGGKMKSTGTLQAGTGLWNTPNNGATNLSGLTILPGGRRYNDGSFVGLNANAFLYSSSENSYISWFAFHWTLFCSSTYASWNSNDKIEGYSIRCLKDETPIISSDLTLQNITIPNNQTNCYNATQTINVAGNGTTFTVQSGGSATMIAGQNIKYLPTTTVQSGGYLWGYIAPTGPWCQTPSVPLVNSAPGESELSVSSTNSFKVYPNPTTGNFILEFNGKGSVDRVSVDIYGMSGEKVLTAVLNGERKHEFSLTDKPVGIYFIRVVFIDRSETMKIIKM